MHAPHLLRYLAERSPDPVGADELYREVWSYAASVSSRALDKTVNRLRKKLELNPRKPTHLVRLTGVGLALRCPVVESRTPVDRSGGGLVGREKDLAALAEQGLRPALLCGGQAKDLSTDGLVTAARDHATRVITFGASGADLAQAFVRGGVDALCSDDLGAAVREAFAQMETDEALLFSPACASFDAFRNFADRAAAFRAALPEGDGRSDPARV